MTKGPGEDLYRRYEADKLLVGADPELSAGEKERAITALTDELLEAEKEAGVTWDTVFALSVEDATGGGACCVDRTTTKGAA